MSDTPRTDGVKFGTIAAYAELCRELERDNAALRDQLGNVQEHAENLAHQLRESLEEFSAVKESLTTARNELARLNGQTRWQCKCGGTDCEGQKDNASLAERLTAAELKRDELGARAERAEAELANLKAKAGDLHAQYVNEVADNAALRAELEAAQVVKESVGKLTEFISSLSPIHAGKRSTDTAINEITRLMSENSAMQADKERLDFLDSQVWPDGKRTDPNPPIIQLVAKRLFNPHDEWVNCAQNARATIDAARAALGEGK